MVTEVSQDLWANTFQLKTFAGIVFAAGAEGVGRRGMGCRVWGMRGRAGRNNFHAIVLNEKLPAQESWETSVIIFIIIALRFVFHTCTEWDACVCSRRAQNLSQPKGKETRAPSAHTAPLRRLRNPRPCCRRQWRPGPCWGRLRRRHGRL